MKKSFFIALAIYLLAGALLWRVQWPKHEGRETRRISLASLTIKKPRCSCQKCACKSHIHKLKEAKPFKKAEEKKLPKSTKPKPKRVRSRPKKVVRKVVHKRVVPRKMAKRIKKIVAKKQVLKKVARESHSAIEKRTESTKVQSATKKRSAFSKSSPQPTKGTQKTSYQKTYIKTYANQIRQAILRHKYYPRIARKTKKQGVVEIYFELTPKKELKNLKIAHSSGHAILDRAALKCVKEASREFPAPKECVKVKVPIEYRLR